MKCKDCKFSVLIIPLADCDADLCCCRYPPVFHADLGAFVFPDVSENDWCGEFKAMEEE